MFKALPADASPDATEHWWHQRLTAGANLFLLLWFVVSLSLLAFQAGPLDWSTFTSWLMQPMAVILMLLLIGSTAYHFRLGLQVFTEDYVKGAGRAALLVLLNFFTVAIVVWAAFSILKVALAAAA